MTMAELDDATRHVLNVKYDMGLFNDPYSHLGPKESDRRTPMPKAVCTVKRPEEVAVKAWCC
ncbi:beta-galactosidase [Enterobacter cloacae]|uniref:Beta-galactosidase n=1 Tax=Enterobacter cloacae TaxID=550 RepID=A0A377LZ91_ENTCL|nr:beta-galactosidase [Enterobacter cloacae]